MKIKYKCNSCNEEITSVKPLPLKDGCPKCKGRLTRVYDDDAPNATSGFTDPDVRFAQEVIYNKGGEGR